MRTLYESILDSDDQVIYTNTRQAKEYMIRQWCDKHFRGIEGRKYDLDKDLNVICFNNNNLIIEELDEKVPEYIKFGDLVGNLFIDAKTLRNMTQEQLPKSVKTIYIQNDAQLISNITLNVKSGVYFQGWGLPIMIKNLTINNLPTNSQYVRSNLTFNETGINLENLHKIRITGEDVYRISMEKTPASREILKNIKKLDKKQAKNDLNYPAQEKAGYEDYLDRIFSNFPNVRFIDLGPRTRLEHNPISKKWIVY